MSLAISSSGNKRGSESLASTSNVDSNKRLKSKSSSEENTIPRLENDRLSIHSMSSSSSSQSFSSSLSSSSQSSSSGLDSHSRQVSFLQVTAIQELNPAFPLSKDRLQYIIRDLFIKTAEDMQCKDAEAIRFTKAAIDLNPPDQVKARLLLILGEAHSIRDEMDAFDQAIRCYDSGIKLTDIPDSYKAKFYLQIGRAYLARKQNGDEDMAIDSFQKGLKIKSDDNMMGDLYIAIGQAFKQKSERM